MRYRVLGRSGLRVSQLFLGAMTFADGFAHGPGLAEARRIIDVYADAGGNVIDTAFDSPSRPACAGYEPTTSTCTTCTCGTL